MLLRFITYNECRTQVGSMELFLLNMMIEIFNTRAFWMIKPKIKKQEKS